MERNVCIDVLIVGAGPVGLTLANDLAARGVSFRIIDGLAEANRNSRAHGLQSRTLEALDRLELAQPMLAAAVNPQPPLVMFSGKKVVARIDLGGFHHEPFPYQLIVWQQQVERVLAAALERREKTIERSIRLTTFEMDDDGVTAYVEGGNESDTIRSRWIVGCDGGHSTVRERLGLKMRGKAVPGHYMLAEVDLDWPLSRDEFYEWWHKDGIATAGYIDFTGKWHVIAECETEMPADLPTLQRLFRERSGYAAVTLSNPAWMHLETFHQGAPAKLICGRAILAGDAAHVHSAAGGQGMNTGIQDALNLGWKLALAAANAAPPSLLQTYESERLANARELLRTTEKYHHIQAPQGRVARLFSGAFFKGIEEIKPLAQATAAKVGMLDLNYRPSSLSRQKSRQARRRARAGDFVPDAACRLGGDPVRLFDVLRGTKGAMLLFAGTNPSEATIAALKGIEESVSLLSNFVRVYYVFAREADVPAAGMQGDTVVTDGTEHLQIAFGLGRPEAIYVRPDGYIGLRTVNLRSGAVCNYLRLIYSALA
ncbi:MAG TPA: FAD-dependent monooxygenase [Candidatus Cybelea sp.]|jgi:2-polyprenyl-6-methoxyphenol hydroxylase-like FAD-dependent oxidoreductase